MIVRDKVALITGGARGIGRAIAERLLQNGAKGCLLDVDRDELTRTETELRNKFGDNNVITSVADITSEEQFNSSFAQAVSKFGQIDILVNNAAIQKEGLWEKMMNINLGGTIRGTLLAMKYMNPDNGGVVVNISSISGIFVDRNQMPLVPVYTTTKAGIIAYTRCFALNKEVVSKKIRMVCLCPGSTDTFMLRDKDAGKCWDVADFYSFDRGRLMTASELAEICEQLIEDDTNSGKVAKVDGPNKYTFV